MKILVTGAAGFIGSSVTESLLARGDQVVGLDSFNDAYSPARKRKNVAPFLSHPAFTLCEFDFRDKAGIEALFEREKLEGILHLGALANVRRSVAQPHEFIDVNVLGTANLLEAARLNKVTNFVLASTSSVYGSRKEVPFFESDSTDSPLAPYPASKKAGEVLGYAYHNMHGMNFTALRLFNVYGPKGRPDMMPYIIVRSLLRGEEITLFDEGRLMRDWTFIGDIVAGFMSALDHPEGYQIFNLGRGEPLPMTEFLRIAEDLAGRKIKARKAPAPPSEPPITFASVEKAGRVLGYKPQVSVREGMERFVEWFMREALPEEE